jgi:AAHS family 4-hydroxybenzoate transporter-like MFS transporter
MADTLNITRFIDERRMNNFNAKVVIFCFFIILMDGYDIGAVGFAGPSLVKAWGLQNMVALGTAFSAGLFGILFGSPLLGWIGDRYGRNRAIVLSLMVIGVFTLATALADSLSTLIVLRFITGIGIGGMLPNTIALNAEFAPRRARATLIIVMFAGRCRTMAGRFCSSSAASFRSRSAWRPGRGCPNP